MDNETNLDMENETNSKADAAWHVCGTCNREFRTASALISHMKSHGRHTEGYSPEPEQAPWLSPSLAGQLEETLKEDFVVHQKPQPSVPVIQLKKLNHYKNLPDIAQATPGSAAYDLYAAIDKAICLAAGERDIIPTGLQIELPVNFVAKVVPRSGLAIKNGITLLNSPGIIDSDYRGEIKIVLINHSRTKFWVEPGTRIAQMLIEQLPEVQIKFVDELSETSRVGGFGSTGS